MTVLYHQDFSTLATSQEFASAYPDLDTRFGFGTQKNPGDHWPDGSEVTIPQAFSSRYFSPNFNVQVDAGYYPKALGPKVQNKGQLQLPAWRFPPADRPTYGQTRPIASTMISPKVAIQPGCRVTVRALFMQAPIWPGVWLYNYATKDEIDFMEAYPALGRAPFSTLHPKGQPGSTNAPGGHAVAPGEHTYGGVWTDAYVSAEIDGHEVWRAPNPGLAGPMRLIVDMDFAAHCGTPADWAGIAVAFVSEITVESV